MVDLLSCPLPGHRAVLADEPAGRAVRAERGQAPTIAAPAPGVSCPRWWLLSVSTKPGSAALTRMPSFRSSLASCTVSAVSAVLEGAYAAHAGSPASGPSGLLVMVSDPMALLRLTIRGAGDRRSGGSMALGTASTPKTLVANTARTISSSTELGTWSRASWGETCPEPVMPALLTSTSRWPKRASTRLAASRMVVGSVTSRVTACASPPAACTAAAASSPRRGVLAPIRTVMPTAASCSAVARPIPLFAPVISATCWWVGCSFMTRLLSESVCLVELRAARLVRAASLRA